MESCATLSAAVVDFHRTGTLQSAEVRHERFKKSPKSRLQTSDTNTLTIIITYVYKYKYICINNIRIYVHISGYSKSLLIFHQPPNSKNTQGIEFGPFGGGKLYL